MKTYYGIPKPKGLNYGIHLKKTKGYTYWTVRYREDKTWKARTIKATNEDEARALRDVFYNYLLFYGVKEKP